MSEAAEGSGDSAHAVSPKTPGLQVVASGLNQPHKLSIGPDGNIYVAEAGDGVIGAGRDMAGTEPDCANNSGTIDRITPQGSVTHVVTGLPSVGSFPGGVGSGGVADARVVNGKIYGVIQNQNIDPTTGQQTYGTAGALLGDLVSAPLSGGTATSVASFALIKGIEVGSYDASFGALSVTADRAKLVDFTQPFFATGLGIAVPAGDGKLFSVSRILLSPDFIQAVLILIGIALAVGFVVWLFERRKTNHFQGGVRGSARDFGGPPSR